MEPLPEADVAPPDEPDQPKERDPLPAVVFLGDSLTAGHGLAAEEAYPSLIQQRLEEQGLPFRVVNAGVSGDTSAGGASRIDWLLRRPVAVLFLALGANDGLRGLPLGQTEEFLDDILSRTRDEYPNADLVVAGMMMPPNLGLEYTADFQELFPRVAARHDATLLPFLLEGVAADPALNQADGIHPTADGQRLIAEHVWQVLEPILERRDGERGADEHGADDQTSR
ncbi:MAG TPA: arylesterase [Thermoanaerobaculia bacterium]|nr:arylesterase [Thermoanaerobaculia bacterium]